jgi:hypothetical protein
MRNNCSPNGKSQLHPAIAITNREITSGFPVIRM